MSESLYFDVYFLRDAADPTEAARYQAIINHLRELLTEVDELVRDPVRGCHELVRVE
jgi:hypothetical protein